MLMRCLGREFRLFFYNRSSFYNVLIFLLVIVSLFPLAMSADNKLLKLIGPGILWISMLLSMMLSMHNFFSSDYEDGSLDQIIMSPMPTSYYVVSKAIAHWVYFIFPLMLLIPLLTLFYQLSLHIVLILVFGLLLGAPSLLLIASLISALVLPARHNSMLTFLMVLPLYVPILILGTISTQFHGNQWPIAPFCYLLAMLLLIIVIIPPLTAGALKNSINQ